MFDKASFYNFLKNLPEDDRRRFSEMLKRIAEEQDEPKTIEEKQKPHPKLEFFTSALPFGFVMTPQSFQEMNKQKEIEEEKIEEVEDGLPPILESFTTDLTEMARLGLLQPVFGRETELDRLMTILMRKNKSNPVLLGEAGVGKTAIVEALAIKIATEQAPKPLANVKILSLNLASLNAGTRFRGDIEERIQDLIDTLLENPDYILFIDELHMLYNDNSNDGNVLPNILKPYLARGEIKVIGATTFDEYRKTIEKDKALLRRFQSIKVEEPNKEAVLKILQSLKPIYEAFHKVKISDEILSNMIDLAGRYFSNRHNPDKTLDLLDESLSLAKKNNSRVLHATHIRQAIASQTNIKNAECLSPQNINGMVRIIKREIIGQDEAIDKVAKILRRKLLVKEESQPLGSFIFMGPTGVGKTELARQLARNFTGSENDLIRFDMSEFTNRESMARLVGAPAGYVGYDDGGNLTEAIRRNPHSVILFDEIEKAHTSVYNLLLQILDTGLLSDAKGNKVSFRNAVIVLTSNLGSEKVYRKASLGFGDSQNKNVKAKALSDDAKKSLEKIMKKELMNRFDDIVVFNPLSTEVKKKIIKKLLNDLSSRLAEQKIFVKFAPSIVDYLNEQIEDLSGGVRPLSRLIDEKINDFIIEKMAQNELRQETKTLIAKNQKINFK